MAQEMATPVEIQIPILSRILVFDRQLQERAGDEIVIGIVYQQRFRASRSAKDEVVAILDDGRVEQINGIPVRYVLVDLEPGIALVDVVRGHEIDLLYVAPLRAFDIRFITALSRDAKILTYSGVPEYVNQGISVGLDTRGGRPEILVNTVAAAEEGADFSSELLKLARIIESSG